MLERLELHHLGPAPELSFDFAPRLNLITGDNGLGKTFLLDVAWWVMTRTWASYPAAPHRGQGIKPTITYKFKAKSTSMTDTSEYDFQGQTWPRKQGRPANPGMVLYARVDGSFSVWDPARNYWKRAPSKGVEAPDRPAAYHFTSREVWNGLESNGKAICNGLIRDWAFWQTGNNEAFQELQKALEALSPSPPERLVPGALTRISLEDVREMPTLKTSYGQEVPVVHASAAVQRIIAMAYLLVWTWQEHLKASHLLNEAPSSSLVFLIDEIETHLHPRWQRTILKALLQVITALTGTKDMQVQALVVTHSPLLLASLEPLFDDQRDSLWNLDLLDGQVTVRREAWRRRGDANSWLISDIFDLAEPRSLEAEQAMQRAEALMERSGVAKQEYIAVREALRASLPDIDPFWLQWRFWVREQGFES